MSTCSVTQVKGWSLWLMFEQLISNDINDILLTCLRGVLAVEENILVSCDNKS